MLGDWIVVRKGISWPCNSIHTKIFFHLAMKRFSQSDNGESPFFSVFFLVNGLLFIVTTPLINRYHGSFQRLRALKALKTYDNSKKFVTIGHNSCFIIISFSDPKETLKIKYSFAKKRHMNSFKGNKIGSH